MGVRSQLRAWWRRGRVGVWYHRDYAMPGLKAASRVEHVDLERGQRVLEALAAERLLGPETVRRPKPASVGQLRRFHPLPHLEAVETPSVLGRVFGLEAGHVDVDSFLVASRRAVGGTIEALHAAARGQVEAAVNLGGGFHHAEPEQGGGFCVFNDIGVGIADLRRSGWTGRVAIVDLDFHQGNGNTVAFADDRSVFVYSLHGAVWTHVEPSGYERHLSGPVNDRRYLGELRTSLETHLRRFRPHLIVYIAGADVLAGDRLGSFWLTARGVFERDKHVFEVARSLDVPLVVTLGGGYGPEAWRTHHRFCRSLITGSWRFRDRPPKPSLRARFTDVASALDVADLHHEPGDSAFGLTEEDLFEGLWLQTERHRFLGFYTSHGVEVVFERYGLLDAIRRRGFKQVEMELDPSDPLRQIVRVRAEPPDGGSPMLLVELVTRRKYVPSFLPDRDRLEVVFVEWLLLQDPSRSFSLSRPPLPGQEHPGLGLAREVQELLVQACLRLGLAALMDRPAHYHNAVVCASEWRFVDPKLEGRFRALQSALAAYDLLESSQLVHTGRMHLADGTPVRWEPGEHALPVDEGLREHFSSTSYKAAVRAERARLLARGLTPSTPKTLGER